MLSGRKAKNHLVIHDFPNPSAKKKNVSPLKKVLLFLALMLSLQLNGQAYNPDEAILIGEVRVRAESDQRDYLGFKSTHLDSALLAQYNHQTIADLLSGNSVIHVKSFGSGGLATPSFRGTGPSHTRVSWNDVNLNSPMLGQFDLSLIPAGFIDGVNIYYGAGSMGINSGGFGGVIDLHSKIASGYIPLENTFESIVTASSRAYAANWTGGSKNFGIITLTDEVTDARDYLQNAIVLRYSPEGSLISSKEADVIPGNMFFKSVTE